MRCQSLSCGKKLSNKEIKHHNIWKLEPDHMELGKAMRWQLCDICYEYVNSLDENSSDGMAQILDYLDNSKGMWLEAGEVIQEYVDKGLIEENPWRLKDLK